MSGRSDDTTTQSSSSPSELTRQARAARNADTLRGIWRAARAADDFTARRAVAENTFSDADLLDRVISDPNVLVVRAAVRNLNISTAALDRVLGIGGRRLDPGMRKSSRWIDVVVSAAWNPALSPTARRRLGNHDDPRVRTAIAFRLDLSDPEFEHLLDDDNIDVAAAAAYMLQRDPERFPMRLADLRRDVEAEIARAAAGELPEHLLHEITKQDRLVKGMVLRRPWAAGTKVVDPNQRAFRDRSRSAQAIGDAKDPTEIAQRVDDALAAVDYETLRTAAGNWNCGAETLDILAEVDDVYTVLGVVRHQRTTGATLDRIFAVESGAREPTRLRSLLDRAGDDAGLRSLVRIAWRYVEIAAARHARLYPPLRRHLGSMHFSHDSRVLRELAARPDLSDWEIEEFGTHGDPAVRGQVAVALFRDPDRIPWLFQDLQSDAHPYVRGFARGKSRDTIRRELDSVASDTKDSPSGTQGQTEAQDGWDLR